MVVLTEQIIKGKTRLDKLEEVKNLNLWGQDLDDCSILAKLPNLEVLSLSVNRLSSLKDFRHCAKLQELYLRKNDVKDLNEIQYLVHLKDLRVLWLSDNPCAEDPHYKQFVVRMLPNLQKLDNDDVDTINLDAAGPGPALNGPAPAPPAPSAPPYASPPYGDHRPQSRGSPATTPSDQGVIGGTTPGSVSRPTGGFSGGGGGRSSKNILYAVMALLGELDDDDLVYVRREIEQRLSNR
ncbi:hypothetical protein VOLCADRAFT_105471 [Volvox carteri f. nagariensis]|uniref:U2A'/phosphoprotein 32 family A C-terminal domain-containing protein n=1 Tax=Volvox carteri f. nagariensis TaxID=3068 RepID=D8U112_VOLCA|nr:uncharacterized protein VOLCADRAFT_105471 [Volvox carteri f. nagariensis]EFJ46477.1 hypothetical protein VOLCADRAFT_105471 [Volvox carteri f. nagariensis]|eukprot:XP_002952334.1 hypothetical protein VOLCADRAFT_105471 [Volvox carteri f. nagariensis]